MDHLTSYLIKSSAVLAVLFLYYLLLLRRDTYYQANRFYLLLSMLSSFIIPLVSFPVPETFTGYAVSSYIIEIGARSGISQKSAAVTADFDLTSLIYTAVTILFAGVFLFRLASILNLILRSKKSDEHYPGIRIMKGDAAPFSFFNYIFIPENRLQDSELEKIIRHERAHAINLHSIDMILADLMRIILWFNPLVWLLRRELIAQHEFIADKSVIDKGAGTKEYGSLLLSYSLNSGNIPLTNNFSSLIKRRIIMLNRSKSGGTGIIKLAMTLPVFLLLTWAGLLLNNDTLFSQEKGKDVPKLEPGTTDVYTFVEEMPRYPKGQDELLRFISSNVIYPAEAKKNGVQGKVMIGFIVEKDGSLSNIRVIKGVDNQLDEEAVRVTKLMGKWIPGKQGGKPVRVGMVLPFQFKLQ